MKLAVNDETVSFSLEVNVEPAEKSIRRLQTLLYQTLGLLRRMGLSEEADQLIRQIQQIIGWLNRLRLLALLTQASMGPIGWALLAVGVATLAYDITAEVEGYVGV